MATTTAQAASTTTPNDWDLVGASKPLAVNPPDDDAGSYIDSTGSALTEQWFACSPAPAAGDTITGIAVTVRHRRGGVSDAAFKLGYQFTPQGGGTQGELMSGSFTAGAAWQTEMWNATPLSVVYGSGFQLYCRNTQTRRGRITTLTAEVTHTPAASGDGQPMVARARLVPGMRRPHGQQGW